MASSIEDFEELSRINTTDTGLKIDLDVLTRIANAFYENSTLKKTHLFFVSRTNWHAFDKYLNWLMGKNFIKYKINEKDTVFQLTENGRKMFNALLNFQEEIGKTYRN